MIITSDKCYLNKELKKVIKAIRWEMIYICAKASAEIIFKAYSDSFLNFKKFRYATVRAGNVIGDRLSKNRIIPDVFGQSKIYH